jgi:hypothetical protein
MTVSHWPSDSPASIINGRFHVVKLGGIHPVPHFSQMCMFVDSGERSSTYQSHDVKSVLALKTELQNTPKQATSNKSNVCNRVQRNATIVNRGILSFNMSFGRELIVLLTKPSMFGMPKWVWPLMNRYRMFFIQTSTLPPCMHHKLTKHGRFCKQNNQLPTKTHVELNDNSIVWEFSLLDCTTPVMHILVVVEVV